MPSDEHESPKHSFEVEVRTPSNAEHDFEARGTEKVHELAKCAVAYFVEHQLTAAGEYGLAVLRHSTAVPLDDSSSLQEAGVDDEDVLVLIAKSPKVDG